MQAFCSCRPQNCSQLIQTIEDTGTIMREVRDLEEQVRLGAWCGTGVGLTKAGQGTAPWFIPRGCGTRHSLQLESQPCLLVAACVTDDSPAASSDPSPSAPHSGGILSAADLAQNHLWQPCDSSVTATRLLGGPVCSRVSQKKALLAPLQWGLEEGSRGSSDSQASGGET